MTPHMLLILLVLFQIKHLLADFLWQTGWMVANKGTYGHPGGIAHAGLHGLLSVAVLGWSPMAWGAILVGATAELVVHYHIDWTKERLLKRFGWGQQEKAYWGLVGLDQFAHQVTYIAILWVVLATL